MIMEFLDSALKFVTSLQGQATIGAIVAEVALRFFKTEKPLSIMHLIAIGCHKSSEILGGLADFLDKILPQKLTVKEPK